MLHTRAHLRHDDESEGAEMVHPCAACHLRFASSGELLEHIRTDHVEHPDVAAEPHAAGLSRAHRLTPDSFTRAGWVARPSAHTEPAGRPEGAAPPQG